MTALPDQYPEELHTDLGTVREIEDGLFSSWPSQTVAFDATWVLRAASGYTGRANSTVCFDPMDDRDLEARLDALEGFYRRLDLDPTFRVTPLTPPAVAAALVDRRYVREDDSIILAGALPPVPASAPEAAGIKTDTNLNGDPAPSEAWLTAACATSRRTCEHKETMRDIVSRIACPAAFMRVEAETGLVPCHLLAACHRRWLTFHSVATLPSERRKGYARTLLWAGLSWGRSIGATDCWIAVERDNLPAVTLYTALGLKPAFGYHYLRKV